MSAALLQITNDDRLRGIVRAYRVAEKDARAKLPTYLSLLIEAAELALQEQENRYAEIRQRADQLERIEGPAENSERVMQLARGRA